MLSTQENERLTRVSANTPMGDLLRRYWHPIAAAAELDEKPTKPVRLLGEDLVLFKSPDGVLGLVGNRCPHRLVDLSYGVPEAGGSLRCMYHGWRFDGQGRCVEQPFEETVNQDSRFKEKVRIAGYPVEELGGLIFAYMGPAPAPMIPRWGPLVWENSVRDIAIARLPCNWLQCQENSVDPVHVEWLHSYYGQWQELRAKAKGLSDEEAGGVSASWIPPMRHQKIAFEPFTNGIIKRRLLEGFPETSDDWTIGHPVLFPHTLLVGSSAQATLQFRVPVDDENTYHVSYYVFRGAPGHDVPEQPSVPYRDVPLVNEAGDRIVDMTFNQDFMCWITQGTIADRSAERLGESDRGIILFRQMLKQQMDIVADGGEPMNVFRSAAENECLEPPLEHVKFGSKRTEYSPMEAGISPAIADINAVYATWKAYKAEVEAEEPVLQH